MKATRRSSTPFLNELAGFGLLMFAGGRASFPVYIIPSPASSAKPARVLISFCRVRYYLWRILLVFRFDLIGTALALLSNTKLSDPVSAMVQAFQVIPAVTVGVILVIVWRWQRATHTVDHINIVPLILWARCRL